MSGLSDQHRCLDEKLKLCKKTHIDYLRAKKFALDINIALEEMLIDVPYIFSNIHIRDENATLPFGHITYSCKNHMNEHFSFEIEFKLVDFSGGFHGVEVSIPSLKTNSIKFRFNFGTLDFFMFVSDFNVFQKSPEVITFQTMIEAIHHKMTTYFLSNVKHNFQ